MLEVLGVKLLVPVSELPRKLIPEQPDWSRAQIGAETEYRTHVLLRIRRVCV